MFLNFHLISQITTTIEEKLNSSLHRILLGFSSQFTDYFAKRITKFLKPRFYPEASFDFCPGMVEHARLASTSFLVWERSPFTGGELAEKSVEPIEMFQPAIAFWFPH